MKPHSKEFAHKIRKCGLGGAGSECVGLYPEWDFCEGTVHDMAHMVVLGAPIDPNTDLEYDVHYRLRSLPRSAELDNEIMTLAVEFLFFKRVGALQPEMGRRWVASLARTLPPKITIKAILGAAESQQVGVLSRRLYRRLKYWANRNRSPRTCK